MYQAGLLKTSLQVLAFEMRKPIFTINYLAGVVVPVLAV